MVTFTTQPTHAAEIRNEFDKVLMQHISGLIDTREDIAALPFNMATIACLLLLVERENEIKAFPGSPPERYNRETFFTDLEEVGIVLDEEVLTAIQNLDQYGFVIINSKSQYAARESSALLIMVLDTIFPQMPGMNLVAYVSQSIEEVVSGRKGLAQALEQFDQTLTKQGVRLSALPKSRVPAPAPGRSIEPKPDEAAMQERRATYLQRLKGVREKSLKSTSQPSVVTPHGGFRQVEVTELFPKRPEVTPPSLPDDVAPAHPDAALSAPPAEIPSPSPPDEMADEVRSSEVEAAKGIFEPDHTEPLLEETSAEVETDSDFVDEEPESEDQDEISNEDLIEERIRAFEQELAMPCPICGVGKVISDKTEKGKIYYHCSDAGCNLISWGKPYNMACPICKNPFLIEVTDPEGGIGLKCPRATCSYRKQSIDPASPDLGGKKVALVKKRKGVRRVVRRKA